MQSVKLKSGAGCSANPHCNWQEERRTEETDRNYLIWNLAKTLWLASLLSCKSAMKCHSTAGFAAHGESWSKDDQTLKNWKIWLLLAERCKLFSSTVQKHSRSLRKSHVIYFFCFYPPAIPSLVFSVFYTVTIMLIYDIYVYFCRYLHTHRSKNACMHGYVYRVI